jgi:hypothetical protein
LSAILNTALWQLASAQVTTAPAAHGITNTFNPLAPTPNATPDGFTIAIHGFNSNPAVWPENVVADINAQLGTRVPNQWEALAFDWRQDAAGALLPARADELQAQIQGHYLAQQILSIAPNDVHFVGHSLGGRVIESALVKLSQASGAPNMSATFLDAFTPYNWAGFYGENAAYSESYFNAGDLPFTEDRMPHSLNVNITALRPAEFDGIIAEHSWPPAWYERSVEQFDEDTPPYHGYGYNQSVEAGTAANSHGQFRGKEVTLTADDAIGSSQRLVVKQSNPFSANLGALAIDAHSGATQAGNELTLTVPGGGSQFAWANLRITTTSELSIFDFDYDFTSDDTNDDSTLSFRIRQDADASPNLNQLLYVTHETHELGAWENTGEISWTTANFQPGNLAAGTYTLSFRLDSATASQARIRLFDGYRLTTMLVPEPAVIALIAVGAGFVSLWSGLRRTAPRIQYH